MAANACLLFNASGRAYSAYWPALHPNHASRANYWHECATNWLAAANAPAMGLGGLGGGFWQAESRTAAASAAMVERRMATSGGKFEINRFNAGPSHGRTR
jgi:F0F1-type ATP synthase membrane subunit c/vacuolar-type H+-ATPase subunit K